MAKKISIIIIAILASLVGLYPAVYFFADRKFGLLSSKSAALLADTTWNTGFYTHIVLGGLALLIGWTQFVDSIRTLKPQTHRLIGKIYVLSVLLSAVAGFYIALFASGGIVPSLGFVCLAITWFYTTLKAWMHIKNGRIIAHRNMMIYSYAACLAAVTLRIYLPALTAILGDFVKAYSLVAWLCWVPNMIVAYLLISRAEKKLLAV